MDKSKVYTRTFNDVTITGDYKTIAYLAEFEEDERVLKQFINDIYGFAFDEIKSQMDENGHYDVTNNDIHHKKLAVVQHCVAMLNTYEDAYQEQIAKEAHKGSK